MGNIVLFWHFWGSIHLLYALGLLKQYVLSRAQKYLDSVYVQYFEVFEKFQKNLINISNVILQIFVFFGYLQ